jgi:hypothetical protein
MISVYHKVEEWEHARAKLSHDAVKNEIIPAVFKLCNVISGKVKDDEFLSTFLLVMLPKIEETMHEIEALCLTAEQSLSPRQYFNIFPLSECDSETKAWLPDVTHQLWLSSSHLHFHLIQLKKELAKLNVAVNKGKVLLRDQDLRIATGAADALKSSLNAIAKEFSSLGLVISHRL